jgi:hypothetical protein
MRGFRRSMLMALLLGAVVALGTASSVAAQSYASTLSATAIDCGVVTITGADWEENADVTITIASDSPTTLGTVETDDEGRFTAEYTVAKSLGDGAHTITATSEFSSSSVGITLTGCLGAAGALAHTGSDSFPWAAGGIALILAGAVLVVITHRRRTAHAIRV